MHVYADDGLLNRRKFALSATPTRSILTAERPHVLRILLIHKRLTYLIVCNTFLYTTQPSPIDHIKYPMAISHGGLCIYCDFTIQPRTLDQHHMVHVEYDIVCVCDGRVSN